MNLHSQVGPRSRGAAAVLTTLGLNIVPLLFKLVEILDTLPIGRVFHVVVDQLAYFSVVPFIFQAD